MTLTAEQVDGWSVTIEVNGERVLCISNQHLSGIPDIDKYRDIVIGAAEHLRSFIGEAALARPEARRRSVHDPMNRHETECGYVPPLHCMDCDEVYEDFPLDTTLPHDQWRMIHSSEGGILCANCMVKRAAACIPDVIAMRARFERASDTAPAEASPQGTVMVKVANLLACRDALIQGDKDEAFHQLYWCVDWADPYKPWAEWEALSASPPEREQE